MSLPKRASQLSLLHVFLGALGGLALTSSAAAQGVTYFEPTSWRCSEGAAVEIEPRGLALKASDESLTGRASEAVASVLAWPSAPPAILFVRGAGSQANYAEVPDAAASAALDGAPLPKRLEIRPEGADTWMVGVDLARRVESLGRAELDLFLVRHGERLPVLRKEVEVDPAQELRVARYESSKTLMVVRDAEGRSGSSGTAMSKTGQRSELRPLSDPCTTVPGAALPLRLYLPEGIALRRVGTATHLDSGESVRCAFDEQGFGIATLPSAGPWLIEVHAVSASVPHQGDPALGLDADLCIYTVTLAFEAPPAPPAEKPLDDSRSGRSDSGNKEVR